MRKPCGLTLIELVIVLGVLGVLLALGTSYLRSDRLAVNQAAQSLAAQVTRARLEAIRRNKFVGIAFHTGNGGSYALFIDGNKSGSFESGETSIQTVLFGDGNYRQVRLSRVSGKSSFVFDPRGIPLTFSEVEVVLSNPIQSFSRTVVISAQGKVGFQ